MTAFAHSLLQQLDIDGSPLSGWSVKFFVTGTNTVVTVYKDMARSVPHATPIKADGQGRLPVIHFMPDGTLLRADITFPDGRVRSMDGIDPGSPSGAAETTAEPLLPAIVKNGPTITLTAADAGKLIDVPTAVGNTVALQLPVASSLDNGRLLSIRNFGSGTVIVRTQGTDLINERASLLLTESDETVMVLATGAGFEVISRTPPAPQSYRVSSRTVSSPPASPVAGASYLAPTTAIGVWAPNVVYTADGASGWIRHDPAIGDEVIVTGETVTVGSGDTTATMPVRLVWNGSAWLDEALIVSCGLMHVRGTAASGTSAATFYGLGASAPTVNAWTKDTLTDTVSNTIAGASIAASLVTLPAGRYRVKARKKVHGAIAARIRVISTTTLSKVDSIPEKIPASTTQTLEAEGQIIVTAATEVFGLWFILTGTSDTLTLGEAAAIPGEAEVFCELLIEKLI